MATYNSRHVRIKLYFDNAAVEPSWFLMDFKRLKTISDVEMEISSKFIHCGSPIKLYLCGCVLPSTEKALVLHQNDDVHVVILKKRQYEEPDERLSEDEELCSNRKTSKKKKKRKVEDNEQNDESEMEQVQKQTKREKKKKSKERQEVEARLRDSDEEPEAVDRPDMAASREATDMDINLSSVSKKSQKESKSDGNFSETFHSHVNPKRINKNIGESDSRKRDHSVESVNQDVDGVTNRTKVQEQEVVQGVGGATGTPGVEPEKKKRRRIRNRNKKQDKSNSYQMCQNSTGMSETSFNSLGRTTSETPQFRQMYDRHKGRNSFRDTRNFHRQIPGNKHITFGSDESGGENTEEFPTDMANYQSATMATDGVESNAYDYTADSTSAAMATSDSLHGRDSRTAINGETDTMEITPNTSQIEFLVPVGGDPPHIPMSSSTPVTYQNSQKYYSGDVVGTAAEFGTGNAEPPVLTSVLKSGATVYKRQRPNRQGKFRELTKEEQLQTIATNKSVILQNTMITECEPNTEDPLHGPQSEHGEDQVMLNASAIKKDYTQFSILHGVPREGDKIAYKILEMSDSYTPEVSDYKEARVTSFDAVTQMMEVEQAGKQTLRRSEGKFDLTLEDENESLTNVPMETEIVSIPWSSVIEARLMSS